MRHEYFQFLFYTFCTITFAFQMWHTTCRTDLNGVFVVSTVMAMQHIRGLVIGHAHVAIDTFGDVTTGTTLEKCRMPTSVLKQDNLFFPLHCLRDAFQ